MHFFKIKDIKKFFNEEFEISTNIYRIGIRLSNNIVKPLKSHNIDSEGIIKGSVQIPGDGNPIILASDHPTIGGYPKIATVIMTDFVKLIQMPPRTKFFFKEITIPEAERLLVDYQETLNNIRKLLIKAWRYLMDYNSYFKKYNKTIYELINNVNSKLIEQSVKLIQISIHKKSKVYIVGNGGSASIASHVSVDFTKLAKIPSATFNNSNLITCFANDYGYENWVVEAIKAYTNKNDLIILMSSSGTS